MFNVSKFYQDKLNGDSELVIAIRKYKLGPNAQRAIPCVDTRILAHAGQHALCTEHAAPWEGSRAHLANSPRALGTSHMPLGISINSSSEYIITCTKHLLHATWHQR